MKHIFFYFILALPFCVFGQKKNLSMEEAVLGMSGKFAAANLKHLQWADTTSYSFVLMLDSQEKMIYTDANFFEPDTILSLQQLNVVLAPLLKEPLKKFPAHTWVSPKAFYTNLDNTYYYVNIRQKDSMYAKKIYSVPDEAENIYVHLPSLNIVYTYKDNIYFKQKFNDETTQVTADGSANLRYGTSVHRDEFGIDRGLFWNKDGSAFAFYKMDQSMVGDYPIVDWTSTPAKVNNIKYPFAGQTSHQVKLLLYNLASKNTIEVKVEGPQDQYLTSVCWNPNGSELYIGVLNRAQNHLKMNAYEASSGNYIKTLFEEQHTKYVEPQMPLYFLDNGKNDFVYLSQRDGYMHFYLYASDGTLQKQLTSGNWIVNEYLGYSKKYNEIVFTSTKDGYTEKNIYALNLKTAALRRINSVEGVHTATLSKNAQYVIDNYTNIKTPRNIEITDVQTGNEKRLLTANNKLEEYNLAKVDFVKLKADDGTELAAKVIFPADFDRSKKYPAIVYLYNGPHVQLVKNAFPESGNLWYDYLTQNGYIVFTMDGRGSSNRGFDFESATFRKLGTVEMQDQLKGLSYLKGLDYVDSSKIGVHGWSFGGFMTTSLMLRHPGAFKCGVAGGPVLDWSMYEVMYTERYMDTPQENPEGYKENELISKVENLKGDLLMIHGTNDDVVVWQHSVKFVKACVDKGVQLDYFVYPAHPHNVRGKDRVHLMQKITDYFDEHLK